MAQEQMPEVEKNLLTGEMHRVFQAATGEGPQPPENLSCDRPIHERLDHINDELHILCRLFNKPEHMEPALVKDAVRIALDRVHSLYVQLAHEARTKAEAGKERPLKNAATAAEALLQKLMARQAIVPDQARVVEQFLKNCGLNTREG